MQIYIKDLSIGYTSRKNAVHKVFEGVNAVINSGELTCLLGANGAGKSTLLRTLAGFLPPLSGEILIEKCSLNTMKAKDLSRKIGVVLTEKPDVGNLTVKEIVGMGRSPYTGFWGNLSHEDEEIVRQSLQMVGIEALSRRTIHKLSDGERQKVMIAKVLAQQTPIIILDEPTAFLDFASKVEMMQLLRRLAHEMDKIVILSTHDISLALQLSDQLWIMKSDKEISIGTPTDLAEQGILSHYIEQDDIKFDKKTLSVKVVT